MSTQESNTLIPYNKPYITGKELGYIKQVIESGALSGNGAFTKKCQTFFEHTYHFGKCLLTTSCTDALEMAALLSGITDGDEVILPSYTFVSTANAFLLRGAKLVFADSLHQHPNIDHHSLEALITPKTKAIVIVHYAGFGCEMEHIVTLCKKHNLILIEDAAQGTDSFYKGQALGSFGQFGAFSFHATKNLIAGEGGMLAVNQATFHNRSEIIWEKGTNKTAFVKGEVNQYGWVDIGSSFLPSELTAAFLFAQLEATQQIQKRRIEIWNNYYSSFQKLAEEGSCEIPNIPEHTTINGQIFYLVCTSNEERSSLISHLKNNNIQAVFHYLSLHKSRFFKDKHDSRNLPNADKYTERLVRLPLYYELSKGQQQSVIEAVLSFYQSKKSS